MNEEEKEEELEEETGGEVSGVVTYGKRHYAAGLLWEHTKDGASVNTIARERAERMESIGYCIAKKKDLEYVSYGLADASLGHSVGQMSLAALLLKNVTKSFLGAFSFFGTWVVLGVKSNGIILVDRACANEAMALEEFKGSLLALAWEEVVCPEEWGIEESTYSDFASIVGAGGGAAKIESTTFNLKKYAVFSMGAASALAALLGAYLLVAHLFKHKEIIIVPEVIMKSSHNIVLPKAWAGFPMMTELIKVCARSILMNAGIVIPGWNLSGAITCDQFGITMEFTRNKGTVNWVRPLLKNYAVQPNRISFLVDAQDDGNRVTLHVPIPPVIHYAASPGPGEESNLMVRRYLIRQLQELSVGAASLSTTPKEEPIAQRVVNDFIRRASPEVRKNLVQFAKSRPRNRKGGGGPFTARVLTYTLSTESDPRSYIPILQKIHANVGLEIVFDPKGGSWRMTGKIYEFNKTDSLIVKF